MIDDREPSPPVKLGVFSVEYLGRRGGLRALRILAGRHELHVFASLDGIAARLTAEIDGKALVRRKKHRPFRVWSNDLDVKRWVLCAASEEDFGVPRWSCRAISHNLRRHSGARAQMSAEAVRRMIWRLAPTLAKRRSTAWRAKQRKRETGTRRYKDAEVAQRRATARARTVAELRGAGLL